ncbi:hypothetical protein, partial [Serratia marcescens]|uniref:hypothetical protein n=1 Tax=Serratia marcescens TaxID=615 RepID=UPI003AB057A9
FEGLGCVLANTNLNVLTAVFYWFTLKRDEPHFNLQIDGAIPNPRAQRTVHRATGHRVQDRGGKAAMNAPSGFRWRPSARAKMRMYPSSTATGFMGTVSAIEAGGILPAIAACNSASPVIFVGSMGFSSGQ